MSVFTYKPGWRPSQKEKIAGIRAEQLSRAIEVLTIKIEDPTIEIDVLDSLMISLADLHKVLGRLQETSYDTRWKKKKNKKKPTISNLLK